jgi:hypothetical protein
MGAIISLDGYRGVANVMTTALDALAATTGKAISAAFDNSVELDMFADFELLVDWVIAPTANTVVELYIVPTIDGTNYSDGSTSILPQPGLYVGGFVARNDTAVQRMVLRGVPMPPGLWKALIQNTTNQAFPASGSTLRYNKYGVQSV